MWRKHGVCWWEALEAAEGAYTHKRSIRGLGAGRFLIAGKTDAGRRLWVTFEDESGDVGRIITAREPSGEKEVRRHREVRGD